MRLRSLLILFILTVVIMAGAFAYISHFTTDLNTKLTAANVLLTVLLAIATTSYTLITGRLLTSEFGPKLYVEATLSDSENTWNKAIMQDFYPGGELTDGPGFSPRANKIWLLKVVNNGLGPAIDVELTYTIEAFVNELPSFKPGGEEYDPWQYKPKLFKKATRTIKIPYLQPNTDSDSFIVFYTGTFPHAILSVNRLRCKGSLFNPNEFISQRVVLTNYFYEGFEHIGCTTDLIRLLGLETKS